MLSARVLYREHGHARMANLGGRHRQARTGREWRHWSACKVVNETECSYVTVISDGRDDFGPHEGTLRLCFNPKVLPIIGDCGRLPLYSAE